MNLLYLAHRIPFPPNKGDKIRSFNELRYLASRHRVHLGCFVDQPEDMAHVPALAEMTASVEAVPLSPLRARMRSLTALASSTPLSVRYFESQRLRLWVDELLARERIDAVVLFSSPMASYVWDAELPRIMDFCDVDSDKWRQYAESAPWPLRPIYALEARRLRVYEEAILQRVEAAALVTDREKELWADLPADLAAKVHVIPNGVDLETFVPGWGNVLPETAALVFTGAMDYYANVDAVVYFAEEVFPRVRGEIPEATFTIVGSRPTSRVRALASRPGVVVTGTVDDVRPYYARASVCVVPLRIARGIQNKVLEALAMGRPVVASTAAAAGLGASVGEEVRVADAPEAMAHELVRLLRDPEAAEAMGRAGRQFVERTYLWERSIRRFESLVESSLESGGERPSPAQPEPSKSSVPVRS
jgi:sugar transferase (PEP-CTERM/EpsH1 system associated)